MPRRSILRRLLPLALLAALAGSAAAQDRATLERQFRGWLEQTVWPRARAEGVSRATFEAAVGGISLDWDLPGIRRPGSAPDAPRRQEQAEFSTPASYFDSAPGTAGIGRQMAGRHGAALDRATRATGVPGRFLLAIWGRESGFGRVSIPHDAFEVLGTRAFLGGRGDYFTGELVAALEIAEAGHAPQSAIRSSWAGALGQPQFMPTSFLRYAADGTGDGHADIWRSEADTLASIGNYLAEHGWQSGRDWGYEVSVPRGVSCTLEGPDQGRSFRDWSAMGIERVSGRPFPEGEMGGEGYLLMPAGRSGPAFVVTPNFYVLKDYNMSDLYALFIGQVADRIAYGMGDFAGGWARVDDLYRSDVAAIQRALVAQGHDVGGADGLAGFKTRRSIGRWQEAQGRAATCWPSAAVKSALAP